MFKFASIAAALLIAANGVHAQAETHIVRFANNCGHGTPRLVSQTGVILSTGGDYTSHGPLIGAIAYLQTGNCGLNGDRCTIVETTLRNPTTPGSGSSTDISLIPPLAFSVTTGFGYFNGCDGTGADCTNANCPTAFHVPTDTTVQVACQVNNANLVITFCE